MPASEEFNPETVETFKKIYSDHKDLIEYKARHGNPTEKAFSKTVLIVAGVDIC